MATWSITPSDGVSNTGGTVSFPKNTGTTNIEYTIKYTDDNGCSGETKYTISAGTACQPGGTCEPDPTFSHITCVNGQQSCTITTKNACDAGVINFELVGSGGVRATGGVNISAVGNYDFVPSVTMPKGNVVAYWWIGDNSSSRKSQTIQSSGPCETTTCNNTTLRMKICITKDINLFRIVGFTVNIIIVNSADAGCYGNSSAGKIDWSLKGSAIGGGDVFSASGSLMASSLKNASDGETVYSNYYSIAPISETTNLNVVFNKTVSAFGNVNVDFYYANEC